MAPSARTSAPWRFLESTSLVPGRDHAALDQFGERHARRVARGHERRQRGFRQRFDGGDAGFGRRGIGLVALEADVAAAEAFCHGAGGAGAVERIDHEVAGLRRRQQHARQQAFGLLGRMNLLAVGALEAFLAGAQRDQPVGTRLHVLIGGLQRFIVERIAFGLFVARGPDHGFVGIGEAAAAKIRHRIGLAPDDIVENPEAEVLHDRADAENVVVGADHPQRRRRFHDAAAGQQPGAGEIVIGGKGRELVPVVVDGVDMGFVGALEVALELQVVRRICEHQIDRTCGKLRHLGDAIAYDDTSTRRGLKLCAGRPCRRPATRLNHDSITLTQATLSATRD